MVLRKREGERATDIVKFFTGGLCGSFSKGDTGLMFEIMVGKNVFDIALSVAGFAMGNLSVLDLNIVFSFMIWDVHWKTVLCQVRKWKAEKQPRNKTKMKQHGSFFDYSNCSRVVNFNHAIRFFYSKALNVLYSPQSIN